MAGFNTPPQPADPGDQVANPLDMAEFTELLDGLQTTLPGLETDPRAAESQSLRQTADALKYVREITTRGAETPEDVRRQVASDVIDQTRAVGAGLGKDKTPSAEDIARAGSFSAMYGLGIGLKALRYVEAVQRDPTAARQLTSWNRKGRQEFMAGVAFEPNHIPDNAQLEELQRSIQ